MDQTSECHKGVKSALDLFGKNNGDVYDFIRFIDGGSGQTLTGCCLNRYLMSVKFGERFLFSELGLLSLSR